MNLYDKVLQDRSGGHVKRFHTHSTIKTQTVGAHSYGVAMIINRIDPDCSKELLLAALTHDLSESITGDLPATAKWDFPELEKIMKDIEVRMNNILGYDYPLTKTEKELLKICDMLELLFFARDELFLGNLNALILLQRGARFLREEFVLPSKVIELLSNIEKEVKQWRTLTI